MEKRLVKLLFTQDGDMLRDITVTVERNREMLSIVNKGGNFLGDVEYSDGSFLSVYYDAAFGFVGFEYDSECNFMEQDVLGEVG